MSKDDILALWGALVVIFTAVVGAIAAEISKHPAVAGAAIGLVVGLGIDLVAFVIYATVNHDWGAAAEKPPQPASPPRAPGSDKNGRIAEIVDSGREPALIVEELRRVMEDRT